MIGYHFQAHCKACGAGKSGICLDTPPKIAPCPKCGSMLEVTSDGPANPYGPTLTFAEILVQ